MQLVTTDEFAVRLKVNRATIYDHVSRGLIGPEPIKLGRATRWNLSEIEDWIQAGCPCRSRWRALKRAGWGLNQNDRRTVNLALPGHQPVTGE